MRFTGQRQESTLGGTEGLYFYGSRWYDTSLGRWAQPDSIIPNPYDSQSWDRYAYVNNNPVRYKDPGGHIPVCEGTGSCSDQWRQDKAYARYGEIGYMKYEIKYEFGIKMEESDGMKWSRNNLQTAYNSLKMINDKLQGNLKSMVSGTAFTIMGGGNQYYGKTRSTGVKYHVASSSTQLPLVNFLHETGHLLDNVPATEDVFSGQVPTTPTWVKDGYVDRGILGRKFSEPVQAIPMNEPNSPGEYWADAFANYVADNIDLMKSAGQGMYNFVAAALAPYVGY